MSLLYTRWTFNITDRPFDIQHRSISCTPSRNSVVVKSFYVNHFRIWNILDQPFKSRFESTISRQRGRQPFIFAKYPPPQKHEICLGGGTRTVLSEVPPCCVFKLPGIEIDADTHKNGLYRIVWVCLDCTETEPTIDSHWVLCQFYRFLSVYRSLSV